jgi:hypothetical protein
MTDPTIICPNCHTEIKLNESLAAPLIEATRKQYQQKLEQKEADFARREATMRSQQADLAKAKEEIDNQVAAKLKAERQSIADEERKKARLIAATDLDQKAKEVADPAGSPHLSVARTSTGSAGGNPRQSRARSAAVATLVADAERGFSPTRRPRRR